VSAIIFVSKDENLTKAHVRFLESRLLSEAAQVGRFTLEQNQAGGSKLPESDREDMEVFLSRIRQLLPVLGSDLLTPIAQAPAKTPAGGTLFCRIKGAEARGQRTPDGFVVFGGSTAVLTDRPSALQRHPFVVTLRKQLLGVRPSNRRDSHIPSCCARTTSVAALSDGRAGVRDVPEIEDGARVAIRRTGDTA
jgi:hypothetical protein